MSETTADTVRVPAPAAIEAPADRSRRLRVGGVMLVFALIGLGLAIFTKGGKATFQLVSGDLQNNLLGVPAQFTALVLGIFGVIAAGAYLLRRVPQSYSGYLAALQAAGRVTEVSPGAVSSTSRSRASSWSARSPRQWSPVRRGARQQP